jgi:carboxylesterase
MKQIVDPRAEPFYFRGGDVGCLLVHGFTGAPDEMRWMGEYLAERNFSVLGVRLFGHGTQPSDMNRARWREWLANVEDGYHMLSSHCAQVVVMGLSLGGALSILLARNNPVAGLAVMATPARIPELRVRQLRPLIPLLSRIMPFFDKSEREYERTHFNYSVYPVRAAAELHDVLNTMRRALPAVVTPALLMYSSADQVTGSENAQLLFDHLGSADKQLLWVENSGHTIPRDAGREQAFNAAAEFAHRVSG